MRSAPSRLRREPGPRTRNCRPRSASIGRIAMPTSPPISCTTCRGFAMPKRASVQCATCARFSPAIRMRARRKSRGATLLARRGDMDGRKIRLIAIDTDPENTVFMRRGANGYDPRQFRALRKVELCGEGRSILATLALCDDPAILAHDEIGIGEPAFRRLGLAEGTRVDIAPAKPPRSLD